MAFDLKNIVTQAKTKLPALTGLQQPGLPTAYNADKRPAPDKSRQLTQAAIIYALGAGVLFMMAIYNLLHGSWFNGIVTLIPAGSLLVLAYKYLQ